MDMEEEEKARGAEPWRDIMRNIKESQDDDGELYWEELEKYIENKGNERESAQAKVDQMQADIDALNKQVSDLKARNYDLLMASTGHAESDGDENGEGAGDNAGDEPTPDEAVESLFKKEDD